jgi:hypothetical protein
MNFLVLSDAGVHWNAVRHHLRHSASAALDLVDRFELPGESPPAIDEHLTLLLPELVAAKAYFGVYTVPASERAVNDRMGEIPALARSELEEDLRRSQLALFMGGRLVDEDRNELLRRIVAWEETAGVTAQQKKRDLREFIFGHPDFRVDDFYANLDRHCRKRGLRGSFVLWNPTKHWEQVAESPDEREVFPDPAEFDAHKEVLSKMPLFWTDALVAARSSPGENVWMEVHDGVLWVFELSAAGVTATAASPRFEDMRSIDRIEPVQPAMDGRLLAWFREVVRNRLGAEFIGVL